MTRMRFIAAGLMLVALLAACGDDDGGAKELNIVGDGTAYTGVATSLDAGVYTMTFQNDADVPDAPLFISSGGNTPEQFLADFAPVLEGGPVPNYLDTVVGFPTTEPGQTVTSTITLPPGDYLLLSFFEDDREPVYVEVTVEGDAPKAADLPDGTVITARDYGFVWSGLEAGTQTFTFRNDGPDQFHHAVLMQFPSGTTAAEAEAAANVLFSLGEGEAPPEGTPEPTDVLDTGVFSPGTGGTAEVTLEAGGTYGLFCFISDRQGGPPHAIAHQMYEFFTIDA